ncbi:MAG: FAD-binding protein [Bacteroidetes bacterium]|nr:MAG: FAD-binding protein [Bacteroidota bacterium]
MQKTIQLQLLPSEAMSENTICEHIASSVGEQPRDISGFHIIKRSLDARSSTPRIILTVLAFIREPYFPRENRIISFPDVTKASKKVIVIGAGPAGLFAALKLIESGIQPIVLERGKDVRARRRDLALLNKEGILNPESNYCFGEGGAGTYSDGKLYTRSTKRGNLERILQLFVQFGADENILYESHPHIGTNKLPHIITAMREQIRDCGGQFLFGKKVIDFTYSDDAIRSIKTADDDNFSADGYILATGHSARDIFHILNKKKIKIEAKPFALGVRIEHPQSLINSIQYRFDRLIHDAVGQQEKKWLPPAAYSLVEQVNKHAVFSFCMCPGGIIAPASTSQQELVVNGWSPSKRNNPYANSGIVTTIEENHLKSFSTHGALAGLHFQQSVERKAFEAGGGKFVAPAQRMEDFVNRKTSTRLPDCSYLPGVHSCSLNEVLPDFVYESIAKAFIFFGKKMKGYYTNEAIVVATESRTSSPVRIPRDPKLLHHPQIRNLFPCGEGAGYAGGIVSAAMDGERIAAALANRWAK